LDQLGSGYLLDFYNEIFLRVIQDVTNDGAVILFNYDFYIHKKSKCFCEYVLHSSQSMMIRVTQCHSTKFPRKTKALV